LRRRMEMIEDIEVVMSYVEKRKKLIVNKNWL
jgi:hypothetical protein